MLMIDRQKALILLYCEMAWERCSLHQIDEVSCNSKTWSNYTHIYTVLPGDKVQGEI